MTAPPKPPVRAAIDAFLRKVSRNYIAGPRLDDAARIGQTLSARGYWLTFGYWDGAGDRPDSVLDIYSAAGERLAALEGENYLSVKAPALGCDREKFRILTGRLHGLGPALHFDCLDIGRADETFALIETVASSPDRDLGCTLPGRWRRSLDDADRAVALGLTVRVVKGQSPDPAEPDRDAAAGYIEVIEKLAGRARRVRVASHNHGLARRALSLLTDAGTPCELELLYGLPVGRQAGLAQEFKVPVRVYVAFGHAYLPYALGSLRRNPDALLKLVREALRGDCLATYPDLSA